MRRVKNNSETCKNVIFSRPEGGPSVELWWRPDMRVPEIESTFTTGSADDALIHASLLLEAGTEAQRWTVDPPWKRKI